MPLITNPHLLLALTTLIWGGNAVAGKFAVGHISPMILTASRWGIALAIIGFIARHRLREDWPIIRANWLYLFVMGGTGYAVFNFCLYSALQYTSAINVTLEQSAMPIVIFVLSFLLYRTRITILQVAGYALTLCGVFLVVSAGDPLGFISSSGEGLNRGDVFMLGAAIAYGGYSVGLRAKPKMHWQSFLAALTGAALLFSLVGAGVEHASGEAIYPTTTQGIAVALFAGIFPSLVSQGLFIVGVEKLGANVAGLYINLVPVWGALLAVLLLSEQLYFFHATAFILVVGGILIAQKSES